MDFYEEASLVMVPSGYKDQKVYSSVPDDGSADLTFSRASNATRVNSEGLVEKVRTNFCRYSQDFASWLIQGTPTRTTGVTDPNGGTTAATISNVSTTGNFSSGIRLDANPMTIGAGEKITASVYLKGSGTIGIALERSVSGTYFFETTMVTLTSSWVRYTLSPTIANAVGGFQIYVANATGSTATSFDIAFVQVEQGDIATSYIPTTTAAVSVGPVSGLPRLNYDAVNPTSASLLLEPQRTNSLIYSEQFDNAAWTKTQSSITANDGVSPDGYTNADKLVANTNNNFHSVSISISDTSAAWTYSVFAKEAGYDRLIMWVTSTNFVGFNLTTGVVESTLGTNITSANIENYGNGWYRCSITSTSVSSGTAVNIGVFNAAYTNGNANPIFTGNGTDGILIYGAQFEAGAYATSYIPTLSTAVTRVDENANKTGISSLIGQTEGVIYSEFTGNEPSVYGSFVPTIGDGTNQNFIQCGYDSVSNGVGVLIRVGGINQVNTQVAATILEGTNKIALAYKQNDFIVYLNGTAIITDTSGNVPVCSRLIVGNNYNSNNTEKIRQNQVLLFKTRLPNSDLATLTTL